MTRAGDPKPKTINDQNLTKATSIAEKINTTSLQEHLSSIVGVRNRFTAKDRITQVENYIFQKLEQYGWNTERQKYRYETFESYDIKGQPKTYRNIAGINVVATKPGKNPDKILLVGAHYDTVDDSPGADDNGTGVAALLEVARVLGKSSFSKTLVLAAFDTEEIGMVGSQAFVKNLQANMVIEGAMILETIGFMSNQEHTQMIPKGFSMLYRKQVEKVKKNGYRGDFIIAIHNQRSKHMVSLLDEVNQSLNNTLELIFLRDPLDIPVLGRILKLLFPGLKNLLRSDHVPFWQKGISAIQLTDSANFRNPNYHQPTDTIETIDFDSLQRLVQTVTASIATLAQIQ